MPTSGELCVVVSKALAVPLETVRQHLRNIRKVENTITFKGYGRGAAAMTTTDAVRLLLTVAGSQYVRDSLETLEGFAKLESMRSARLPHRTKTPVLTLEDHLVALMERLRNRSRNLPAVYLRKGREGGYAALAVKLVSACGSAATKAPRIAIARSYGDVGGGGGITFATRGWTKPVLSEVEYALANRAVGVVQSRHITTWAFAEIALAL